MSDKSPKPGPGARFAPSAREERLKAALKANIQRRKAQARARDQVSGNAQDGAADGADQQEE